MAATAKSLVLVSGASGYLGSHCIRTLLAEGYRVRGTVRSLKNAKKIEPVRALDKNNHLELVEADLMAPQTWPGAVKGVDYVLHVASPFVINADANTIKTAVEGTLNVLRAASKEPSVKKVVLTSSGAAIFDGVDWTGKTFDESCWSVPENSKDDYSRSKTFAEKAAWEIKPWNMFLQFHNSLPKESRFALTTINPTLIVGPLLINEEGTSANIIKGMLEHKYPAVPDMCMGLVDVRDVATAHVKALSTPASDGQRVLLSAKCLTYQDMIAVLRREFETQGYCMKAMTAPYPMMWLASFFDHTAKLTLPLLGKKLVLNNSKSKSLLGVEYRDVERSCVEMAYSLIERGIAQKTKKYRGVPFSIKLP